MNPINKQQIKPKASLVINQHQIPATSHNIVCAISGVSYQVIDQSGIQGYKISQPIHPMMLPHTLNKLVSQIGVAIEYRVGAILAALHHAKLTKNSALLTVEQIEKINYILASSLEDEDCLRMYEAIGRATNKPKHTSYLAMIPKLNLIAILEHHPSRVRSLMLEWLKVINQKHDADTASYIKSTYESRQRSLAIDMGLSDEAITKLANAKAKKRAPMTASKAQTILAKSIMEEASLYPNKDLKSLQKATKQFSHLHEKVQAKLLDCYEEAYALAKTKGMMNKASSLKSAFIYAIDYLRGEVIPHGDFELDLADLETTSEGES